MLEDVADKLVDAEFHRLSLLFAAIAAAQAVAVIYAASSRRHWFWRGLVFWSAVALFAPLRAYEPIWLFATSGAIALLVARLATWRRDGNEAGAEGRPIRFRLSSLLLLLAMAGLWLASLSPVVRKYQPSQWGIWLVSSMLVALATLTIYGLRFTWNRRQLRLAAVPAAVLLATCFYAAAYWLNDRWALEIETWWIELPVPKRSANIILWGLVGFETALLAIAFYFAVMGARVNESPFRRASRYGVLGTISLIAVSLLGPLYISLARRTTLPKGLDAPGNEYKRICEIAAEAGGSSSAGSFERRRKELVRLLNRPNAVVLNDNWRLGRDVPGRLRGLTRLLCNESQALQIQGKYDEAADYAVAALRLASMTRRGGVLIDSLTGFAIHELAAEQLNALEPKLDSKTKAGVLAELNRAIAEQEDFKTIWTREQQFEWHAYGWRHRLGLAIAPQVTTRGLDADYVKPAFERWDARLKALRDRYSSSLSTAKSTSS